MQAVHAAPTKNDFMTPGLLGHRAIGERMRVAIEYGAARPVGQVEYWTWIECPTRSARPW